MEDPENESTAASEPGGRQAAVAPRGGAVEQEGVAERLLLELAVRAGGIGTFDWDLTSGQLRWDVQLLEMFDVDDGARIRTIEDFYDRVHPVDRGRVRDLLEAAVVSLGEYDAEYRVVLGDGTIRWVAARGRAFADEEGRPVRLIGAAQDTTARRDADALVARVMDAMATAFFFVDREWRFGYVNAEAQRLLGRPAGELIGEVLWDVFPAALGSDFETFYRHAADSGEPVAFDAYYPEPLNAWYEVRAWPGPDGLSVYFLDITDRRRAHAEAERAIGRAALLARVTQELASTLDPIDAMQTLARLVVPMLADWSVVTLIDDDRQAGTRRGLGDAVGWHHDPELRPAVEQYAKTRLGVLGEGSDIVGRAVETGVAQVVAGHAMDALRPVFEPGSEPLGILERLHPEAIALFPLIGHDRTVGMLSLCVGAARGGFVEEDLELARDVAGRAGLVLDRARLYRQQRDVAESLQRSLLTEPPVVEGVGIAVRYAPAAEATQIGGDWYDAFVQADGAVVVVIGDVMGHDRHAAAAMGQTRTLVRSLAAHSGGGPARVLRDVEVVMGVLQMGHLATAVVACLEPPTGGRRRLRWSNAGHPPPMLVTPDGAVRVLSQPDADLLLGVAADGERREGTVVLEPGATLLLYTDGLVERQGQALDEGLAALERLLAGLGRHGLEDLCDAVLAELLPAQPGDDVALVAVRLDAP